jgi:hypothetical protein
MVSYKKMYEELLARHNQKSERLSGYQCQVCGKELKIVNENEVVCSDESCLYDRVIMDVMSSLYDLFRGKKV